MIHLRHRYAGQPDYTYDIGAWITRPHLAGPNPTIAIADDARLDEVLARANATFGQPGVMCPPLPTPREPVKAKGSRR